MPTKACKFFSPTPRQKVLASTHLRRPKFRQFAHTCKGRGVRLTPSKKPAQLCILGNPQRGSNIFWAHFWKQNRVHHWCPPLSGPHKWFQTLFSPTPTQKVSPNKVAKKFAILPGKHLAGGPPVETLWKPKKKTWLRKDGPLTVCRRIYAQYIIFEALSQGYKNEILDVFFSRSITNRQSPTNILVRQNNRHFRGTCNLVGALTLCLGVGEKHGCNNFCRPDRGLWQWCLWLLSKTRPSKVRGPNLKIQSYGRRGVHCQPTVHVTIWQWCLRTALRKKIPELCRQYFLNAVFGIFKLSRPAFRGEKTKKNWKTLFGPKEKSTRGLQSAEAPPQIPVWMALLPKIRQQSAQNEPKLGHIKSTVLRQIER